MREIAFGIFSISFLAKVWAEPLFGNLNTSLESWHYYHTDPRYADVKGEFDFTQRTFTLDDSGHQCYGRTYGQRICKFYNLLLWNDTFYYVTKEPSLLAAGLPEIPMSWVHIPFAEDLRFAEGGMAKMVHPDQLPFDFHRMPVLEMPSAVIWQLTYHDNFGHILGEHAPTLHNVLCTYLGKCTFSNSDRDVHILLPHNEDDMMVVVPRAAREVFHCMTKHPLRQTNEVFFKDRVISIGTAVAGIGAMCRGFPWCRPSFGRSPLTAHQVLAWRSRLLRCLNLPAQAKISPQRPNAVIVSRPLTVGRGFLNLNQMLQTLREKFPELELGVHEMDEKLLIEQARVFATASIVIQAHGAALGNLIFLPKGASVIDISPRGHEDKHAWAFYMADDFRILHINPIRIREQRPVPMIHKLSAFKQWQQLTPEWRERVGEEGLCPRDDQLDHQFNSNIWCKFHWILKNSNLAVSPGDIGEAVGKAITFMKGYEGNMQLLDLLPSRRFCLQ